MQSVVVLTTASQSDKSFLNRSVAVYSTLVDFDYANVEQPCDFGRNGLYAAFDVGSAAPRVAVSLR